MAAEGGGAADLDGAHDAPLLAGQRVRLAIGRAVLSKDLSQLAGWPRHDRGYGRAGRGAPSRSSGLMALATTWGVTAV